MASGSSPVSSRKRLKHSEATEYAETTLRIIKGHLKHIESTNDKTETDMTAVKIIQACNKCKYQEFKEFLGILIGTVEEFIIGKTSLDEMKGTFTDAKDALKYMNPVVRHTQIKKRKHIKHSIFNPNPVKADKAQSAFHTFYITFKEHGMPGDLAWTWSNLKKEIKDKNLSGLVSEIEDYLFQYTQREKAFDLIEELGEKLKNPNYQTIGDMKRMIKRQYPGGNDYSWSIALLLSLRKREKCFLMKSGDYYYTYSPNYGIITMTDHSEDLIGDVVDENGSDMKAMKEMFNKNLWPPATGEA